jgi:hypothetical protein
LELIFKTELSREYGYLRFTLAIILGSISSGLVIYILATGTLGAFLIGTPNIRPTSVEFALSGAFAWTIWLLLSGYDALDLVPSAFYWIPFRYVVAIIIGLLTSSIFKETGLAIIFAFLATSIPYPELLNFLRTQIPQLGRSYVGEPPLWKIQGMQQSTVYRLQELGIHTTQELAYVDPLMLLFRTIFPPKVVIDWMDQALLYNYVGENIIDLRMRGIRGAIELMVAGRKDPLKEDIAKVLKISKSEVEHFADMLDFDYQVQLVSGIWDEFRVQ